MKHLASIALILAALALAGCKDKPAPAPVPTTSTVVPGTFCSPEGAQGTTKAGTRMRCTLKPGEIRPRWRA